MSHDDQDNTPTTKLKLAPNISRAKAQKFQGHPQCYLYQDHSKFFFFILMSEL